MRRSPLALIALLVAGALLAAGCGGDDDGDPDGQPIREGEVEALERDADVDEDARERPDRAEPQGIAITDDVATDNPQFGDVLFDRSGQAVYYFEPEGRGEPECYRSCAEAWPPVLTDGEPVARGAIRQRLLGTVERRDGSIQVTYDGRPLYYYADEDRGELRCHNVFHEGGLWLAVQPSGDPVPT